MRLFGHERCDGGWWSASLHKGSLAGVASELSQDWPWSVRYADLEDVPGIVFVGVRFRWWVHPFTGYKRKVLRRFYNLLVNSVSFTVTPIVYER